MCVCVCVRTRKLDYAEVNFCDHWLSQPVFFFETAIEHLWHYAFRPLQVNGFSFLFFPPSTSILFHPSFTSEMQKMAAKGVNNTFPGLCWQSNWNLYTFRCPNVRAISETLHQNGQIKRNSCAAWINVCLKPIDKLPFTTLQTDLDYPWPLDLCSLFCRFSLT